MNNKTMATAALVVVKGNKLLLAFSKNKKAWYLPGGKKEEYESSLESLKREIKEELNIVLQESRIAYYCHITALAYGEFPEIKMEQDCFLYELEEEIMPSNEIQDVAYYDFESYKKEEFQVEGVLKVFEQLKKDGKIIY